MDFNLSPEQVQYQEHVRGWVAEHASGGRDFSEAHMDDSLEAIRERYAEWQRKRFDAKLTCVIWPEQYGGAGLGVVEHYIVTKEIDTLAVVPNIADTEFWTNTTISQDRVRYCPTAARR